MYESILKNPLKRKSKDINSQSYSDIMSIKSLDTFKKVAIENNFEYSDSEEDLMANRDIRAVSPRDLN